MIPEDYIVRYVPHKGDEVRWGFDTAAFNEHKVELDVYKRQLLSGVYGTAAGRAAVPAP